MKSRRLAATAGAIAILTPSLLVPAAVLAPTVAWAHGTEFHEIDPASAPTVKVTAAWDAEGGVNISIAADKFTWVAPKEGTAFVEGEGHAHVLIDGVDVGRAYSPETYLPLHTPGLAAGEHVLQVELAGSDHAMYAVNEEEVSAATKFTVPADFVAPEGHGGTTTTAGGNSNGESSSESSTSAVKNIAWGLGGAAVAIAGMTGLSLVRRRDS